MCKNLIDKYPQKNTNIDFRKNEIQEKNWLNRSKYKHMILQAIIREFDHLFVVLEFKPYKKDCSNKYLSTPLRSLKEVN